MLSNQGETGVVMIERRVSPPIGSMAGIAVCAKLAVMGIL